MATAALVGTPASSTFQAYSVGTGVGASGAVGGLVAVLALAHGMVPPTRNVDEVDPEVDLDIVRGDARPVRLEVVVVNAFGFGGHNASLVFTRD